MSPRHPFEPLRDFVAKRAPNGVHSELSHAEADCYYRSQRVGYLSSAAADRMAVRFGVLPHVIWPTWFEDALDEPMCRWCREPISFSHVGEFCCKEHRFSFRAEESEDARRLAIWWQRVDEVSARVSVMTDDELAAFLGIESDHVAVAA